MTAILELDRMVKRFGGLVATNDFSAVVEQGESLGLIGPNGAGKTTIFSLIMGDHRLTDGAIRLKGEAVQDMATHERIKRGVARTYQVPRPFAEMSVAENIRIGLTPDSLIDMIFRRPDPSRELALAESVGFEAADLDRLPAELSMGDLRKLELARTLSARGGAGDPERAYTLAGRALELASALGQGSVARSAEELLDELAR